MLAEVPVRGVVNHVFYDSQRRRSDCTVYRKAAVRLPPNCRPSLILLH